MRRCFEQGMFADIYFVVHGETIPAHRVILAARSSYFAEMLQNEWQEKMVFFPRTTEVGALTAILREFVLHCYRLNCPILI